MKTDHEFGEWFDKFTEEEQKHFILYIARPGDNDVDMYHDKLVDLLKYQRADSAVCLICKGIAEKLGVK